MKLFSILFAVLAVLATSVYAWDNLDHEIFDMVSEIEQAEGKKLSFYSMLGVSNTATEKEIAKAYRAKSMTMHPDKNPNDDRAHDRFSRLGKVQAILRNKEKRERYDFFYKNGVPKWRGTGYYYSRFRPGLGTVITFLVVLTSGLQYLVQRLNYTKDLARIETITNKAKAAAWGPKQIPINGQRKVRVNLGEARDEEGNPQNARWLDMVVDGNDVFMIDDNGDLVIIDSSTATVPAITSTWFIALFKRFIPKGGAAEVATPQTQDGTKQDENDDESSASEAGSGAATPNGTLKSGHTAATKAGGKRRKAVPKKR